MLQLLGHQGVGCWWESICAYLCRSQQLDDIPLPFLKVNGYTVKSWMVKFELVISWIMFHVQKLIFTNGILMYCFDQL